MKRAAIIVLAIATLVLIVSPSASPYASTPTKSGITGPVTAIPLGKEAAGGPYTSPGGGGGGGGTDQGDADGLSGLKVKPGITNNNHGVSNGMGRVAITLMMWWRYVVLIR
jgi:hypothetical protein